MQVLLNYLEASVAGGVLVLIYIFVTNLFGKRIHKKAKRLVWLFLAILLLIPLPISVGVDFGRIHMVLPTKQIGVISTKNTESTSDLVTQLEAEKAVDAAREYMGLEAAQKPKMLEHRESIVQMSAVRKPLTTGMVLSLVWLGGIVLFLLYHLVMYVWWRSKMYKRSRVQDDAKILQLAAEIAGELQIHKVPSIRRLYCTGGSPFTLGFGQNVIFLPDREYAEKDLYYILKHELVHCKNRDIWMKGLLLAVNGLHWYNPLVWILRGAVSRDMEFICDEEVMQGCTKQERRAYSEVIMACISGASKGAAALTTTYVRGTRFIKARFRQILEGPKRKIGIPYVAGMLCAAICFSGFVEIEEVQVSEEMKKIERDYGQQVRADLDGDGVVELVTVFDNHRDSYALTQVQVNWKNGDVTWIQYPGWWASYMVTGDLNGDGDAEIVLFKKTYGSNVGAGEVKVLYEEDGELKEYTDIFIQNPALEGNIPVRFHMYERLQASCLGTNIVEKDGKALLRLLYLGDDYYEGKNTYDGIKYIDCSYTEAGWYIENFVEIDVFFGTDLWDEVLDYSFIYD